MSSTSSSGYERIALALHFQVQFFDGLAMREVDLVSLQRQRPDTRAGRGNPGHI
jgi:hypothetical protein